MHSTDRDTVSSINAYAGDAESRSRCGSVTVIQGSIVQRHYIAFGRKLYRFELCTSSPAIVWTDRAEFRGLALLEGFFSRFLLLALETSISFLSWFEYKFPYYVVSMRAEVISLNVTDKHRVRMSSNGSMHAIN